MEIPDQLARIISRRQDGGITESDCKGCSSGCCSQGGFAILENVLEIYELYQKGMLKREGFKFTRGLGLYDFIFRHFDVWERPVGPEGDKHDLMFFHIKSIDDQGRLISIPGDSYWVIRTELFSRNPWLNKGCVFLSHPVSNWPEDDRKNERHCILHGKGSPNGPGAKPIDCLYFTCINPYEARIPTDDETDEWFYEIAKAYPESKARFKKIYESA